MTESSAQELPVEIGKFYVRFRGQRIATTNNLFQAVSVLRSMGLTKDSDTQVEVVQIIAKPADWRN